MTETNHRISILSGADANTAVADQAFVDRWRGLKEACPWATSFQGPEFVTTWYDVYSSHYQPVLICGWRGEELRGLLTLAKPVGGGMPVVAGTHQAEYQTWIATPEDQEWFVSEGLAHFQKKFPGTTLTFRYLPGEASAEGLVRAGACVTEEIHQRPLMRIDPDEIGRSLSKKSNKSRFNRLKRVGPVELERCPDVASFERIFDDLIWQYDLRQGAVNQSTPFLEDPLKKRFHLQLMAKPGFMHVTVMRAGDHIVSTHADYLDGTWSYLGMPTHSPFFFQHSPGKLHMMLLGKQLVDEGITCLDLTPGGDPWKERFANDHVPVSVLTLYPSRASQFLNRLPTMVRTGAKRALSGVGLDPKKLKSVASHTPVLGSFFGADGRADNDVSTLVYHASQVPDVSPDYQVSVNAPQDLLRWMPNETLASKHRMLSMALRRLEGGQQLYAVRDGEHLGGFGWLAPSAEAAEIPESVRAGLPNGRVVHGITTVSTPEGEKIREALLGRMLLDAANDETSVIVAVDSRSKSLAGDVVRFGLTPVRPVVSQPAPAATTGDS